VLVPDTVSAPLSLLPAPLARLCARGGQLEGFVFNRAGLAQALALAGFEVEAVTGILRDRPGPAVMTAGLPRSVRARHGLGCSAGRWQCEEAFPDERVLERR
jgi:hypothetical protein